MKRFLLTLALAAYSLMGAAQTPQDEVSLTDMTFVRQSFIRNFYNLRKVVSQINMEGTNLQLELSANLILENSLATPALKQTGRTLNIAATEGDVNSIIRVGAFHPYFTYEVSIADIDNNEQAGIAFYPNSGQGKVIYIYYQNGKVVSKSLDNGEEKILAEKEVKSAPVTKLRVQYTGVRFHVFSLYDDGSADLLYSVTNDMRAVESCITHSFGVYANLKKGSDVTLHKAEALLTCGTGQADSQIIQYSDGSPYIKDGRLYLCLTTRGFERIFDSYQGIYSIDLASYEVRLEGALFFGKGDGIMYGFHATKVVYDKEKEQWMVITTTHEDTHTLAWCSTKADLSSGVHYLECTELVFPHSYTNNKGYNTEDPDFFYDAEAGKWRLAYCALKDKSYVTFLCESDNWNGPYTQIAESNYNNNTGIRIVSVGGKRYVLSGGTSTTYYIYHYPSLRYEGVFQHQYSDGGRRGWPTIIPIQYGNYERYLWITFDRGAPMGRYSYGTLYFFLGDKMWRKKE